MREKKIYNPGFPIAWWGCGAVTGGGPRARVSVRRCSLRCLRTPRRTASMCACGDFPPPTTPLTTTDRAPRWFDSVVHNLWRRVRVTPCRRAGGRGPGLVDGGGRPRRSQCANC